MKCSQILKIVWLFLFLTASKSIFAQLKKGVYLYHKSNIHHEIKVDDEYLILSVYEKPPAKFIKTLGGFYSVENNMLQMKLEFNSDFSKDSLRTLDIPIQIKDGKLFLGEESKMIFEVQESNSQDLDGQWLFATRGPDTSQKRRGDTNTRKTLKFLLHGRFQWIAYNTDGMQFKGSGGGSYTSVNGIYTENIEFFSRDNNRVGASLEFNYDLQENDWHHTGVNSKGKSMYEIWQQRNL